MSDKYSKAIADSKVISDDAKVADAVKKIIDEHFEENNNEEVYKFLSTPSTSPPLKRPIRPSR